MNKIKTLLVILALFWALPSSLFAAGEFPQHHWQPTVTDYNMTATFSIRLDGVLQTGSNLELGAFAGEVCRSSFHLELSPFPNGGYITTGYNIYGEAGEVISFRLYDHSTESEMNVVTDYTLSWVANGNVGSAVDPQVLDFHSASYYILITDESQLVAGRKYLVANGFDGTVKAIGGQKETHRRAVDMACTNRKTYQTPAADASSVYQFTLGGSAGAWTWMDDVNHGYLVVNAQALSISSTASTWTINLSPTGAASIGMGDGYIAYSEGNFSYGSNLASVYLFAKCELVSGTMASLTTNDATRIFVIESGNTLTVDELSTVHTSNLLVEDGAQLLNASSGVLATLQKTITAYDDPMAHDGWFTLASPMEAAAVETGSNLLFPEYDLYFFDETNLTHEEWRNYKNHATDEFANFEAGRGYLYANATSFMPLFKGTLNCSSITFPLTYTDDRPGLLKGFNLIGNPFPHNIYKGTGGAIDDNDLASGYYVLSHSGAWLARTSETPIAPGQGVLVKTLAAHNLSIAKTEVAASGESRSRDAMGDVKGCIGLHLSNGQVEDDAYVYLGSGNGLVKMAHISVNNPSLSIVREEGNFAIAYADAENETVDLCLDIRQSATYSITVDVKNYQNGYLHLKDNLTGADVNLLRTPSYTFEATSRDYPFRFQLVLQGVDADDEPFAYYADGQIHLLVEMCHNASIQVVDMMGRVLVCEEASDASPISTVGMTPGIYVLRLVDGEAVMTQKIVVR